MCKERPAQREELWTSKTLGYDDFMTLPLQTEPRTPCRPAPRRLQRSAGWRATFGLGCAAMLAACGGGGGADTAPVTGISNAQRTAAAQATVTNNTLCSAATLNSYYWEIGDGNGALASGSVGPAGVTADTAMNIASASKWPFAAYVYEKYGDVESHRPFLNFTSGYSNFNNAKGCKA